MNISNLSNPIYLGILNIGMGSIVDFLITKDEKIMYTANNNYGVVIYNISNISNIT